MKWVIQIGLVCFAIVAVVVSSASEPDRYRLAGTIDTGDRGWLAILELSDGEQLMVGTGDSIPGGEVLAVGDKWLRLLDQDGEVVLSLEGGDARARIANDGPEFVNLNVSEDLRRGLDELARSDKTNEQLARDINRLLQIPTRGRIESINDHPVSDAKRGLQLLRASILDSNVMRIEVGGVEGFEAVYLMPEPDEAASAIQD